MPEVRQTETFARWLARLRDGRTRARIQARIDRLELGNPGDVKAVGGGISEMRIDYGPGYRIYLSSVAQCSSFCLPVATSIRRSVISRRLVSWRAIYEEP